MTSPKQMTSPEIVHNSIMQSSAASSLYSASMPYFSLDMLQEPIQHVLLGLFSTLDGGLVIVIIPHTPSMSNTREYFDITLELQNQDL